MRLLTHLLPTAPCQALRAENEKLASALGEERGASAEPEVSPPARRRSRARPLTRPSPPSRSDAQRHKAGAQVAQVGCGRQRL